MEIAYLLLLTIIVMLWLERRARRNEEDRVARLERSRVSACLSVYNGVVGTDWFKCMEDLSKERGLDCMRLLSGIELRDITDHEASITPWDTPETIRLRGKDGLIPWQVHPDLDEINERLKKNIEKAEQWKKGVIS